MEDIEYTKWELSDIPDEQIEGRAQPVKFTEGDHVVKIVDAKYLDEVTAVRPTDIDTYTVTVEDVETGATQSLKYWLKNKERTMFSEQTIGTLNSLGKAVLGPNFIKRVPAPVDLVGAVVVAEIKLSKGNDGNMYVRCYHFQPTTQDNALYSAKKKQYYKS